MKLEGKDDLTDHFKSGSENCVNCSPVVNTPGKWTGVRVIVEDSN